MKRHLLFIYSFLIFSTFLFPASVARFPDLTDPDVVVIDNNQLFITDDVTIYIYSVKDFQLQKKFGKSGFEAHEFNKNPDIPIYITVFLDRIMVESYGRISYFTRKGDFIRFFQPRDYFIQAKPVGENFAAYRYTRRNNTRYICLDLYNSRFEKCKEILRLEDSYQYMKRNKLLSRAWAYCTYKDQLFTAVKKEFIIDVYDHQGDKLYSINKEYENVKVTKTYIKSRLENAKEKYRDHPDNYDYFERLAQFPEYFPAISQLYTDDGVLYVQTWQKENGKTRFYLFDMTGKFIKKVFLPLAQKNDAVYYPSTFHNRKLYQLVKNRDKNIWELHVSIVDEFSTRKK